MLESILQPAIAFAEKDFLEGLRSRRVLTVSIVVGGFLVVASASISFVMTTTPKPDGQAGVPNPYEVWYKGPSGVLTAVAFGLTAVILPFLPILATRTLDRERDRGVLQLSVTKPVPSWGPALGTFVGLYGALAIPTVAISVGVALVIQVLAGASVDGALFASYALGNLLLVALYLLLTLFVGTILPPDLAGPVFFLSWLGFNALRAGGFYIAARLATFVGAREAATFQVAWTDLATFTGIYQAIVAPAVPGDLGFVIAPSAAGALDLAAQAVPWAALIWCLGLFMGYAFALGRFPAR